MITSTHTGRRGQVLRSCCKFSSQLPVIRKSHMKAIPLELVVALYAYMCLVQPRRRHVQQLN